MRRMPLKRVSCKTIPQKMMPENIVIPPEMQDNAYDLYERELYKARQKIDPESNPSEYDTTIDLDADMQAMRENGRTLDYRYSYIKTIDISKIGTSIFAQTMHIMRLLRGNVNTFYKLYAYGYR